MQELRNDIMDLARDVGRKRAVRSGDLALFDSEMAGYLREQNLFSTGEALRDDVWTFVGVVLAPKSCGGGSVVRESDISAAFETPSSVCGIAAAYLTAASMWRVVGD